MTLSIHPLRDPGCLHILSPLLNTQVVSLVLFLQTMLYCAHVWMSLCYYFLSLHPISKLTELIKWLMNAEHSSLFANCSIVLCFLNRGLWPAVVSWWPQLVFEKDRAQNWIPQDSNLYEFDKSGTVGAKSDSKQLLSFSVLNFSSISRTLIISVQATRNWALQLTC